MAGTPEQERQARAEGWPSYEAKLAWARRRMERTGGTRQGVRIEGQSNPRPVATPTPAPAAPADNGNAMGWGPGALFDYIANVLRGANR